MTGTNAAFKSQILSTNSKTQIVFNLHTTKPSTPNSFLKTILESVFILSCFLILNTFLFFISTHHTSYLVIPPNPQTHQHPPHYTPHPPKPRNHPPTPPQFTTLKKAQFSIKKQSTNTPHYNLSSWIIMERARPLEKSGNFRIQELPQQHSWNQQQRSTPDNNEESKPEKIIFNMVSPIL